MSPVVEETQLEGPRMTKFTCVRAFLPSIFAIAAIILGTAANVYCESVMFPQVDGNDDLVLFVGPFSYRTPNAQQWGDTTFVYTTCRSYDHLEKNLGFDYKLDATAKAVWSFSILTPAIGIFWIIGACWGPCNDASQSRWKFLGLLFLLTSVFQGITLLIQSSSICHDNPAIQYLEANNPNLAETLPAQCEWATGFKINIVAVVCWILAGACCYLLPPPLIVRESPRQEQTVTYTQNFDGTVQESHVAVVKGAAV
mmetsp:Transcript_17186/g.39498  ORF Transcript_17186/g.39498 Transcript_17186/m.39498 type:complete len:255 (-) Transcript_17186:2411-3175(-)